ncbi:MAG: hypothetical protein D6780_06300 [Candidatus Dadabacteria bacterium]|nr:MAG: hypothetical protein D6780_06300 [Candidatus Dadabacteria bacterium]
MSYPNKLYLREVGLREGIQSSDKNPTVQERLQLIKELSLTGISEIEVGSFVRPDLVPQMSCIDELCSALPAEEKKVRYSALYLNKKGFLKALAHKSLSTEGWLYFSLCETFSKQNYKKTFSELLTAVPDWLSLFKENKVPFKGVVLSCSFGSNWQGEIPAKKALTYLNKIADVLPALSNSTIVLADTMGWASPKSTKEYIKLLQKEFPASCLWLHIHDTRGLGLTSAYEALMLGVLHFDLSLGGSGGCPFAKGASGNIATEDFLYLCKTLGINTSVNLEKYLELAVKFEELIGQENLSGRCYKVYKRLSKLY